MQVVIVATPAEVGRLAAAKIGHLVRRRPDAVLGLATGSSPLAIYAELARQVARGRAGLLAGAGVRARRVRRAARRGTRRATAPCSTGTSSEPLGMDPANVHVPDGSRRRPRQRPATTTRRGSPRPARSTCRSSASARTGTSGSTSRRRRSPRAPGSRRSPRRPARTTRGSSTRPTQVPTHCLTQGLGTILDATTLVLVAQGEAKADAVAPMVEGPVSSMCPGSALQLHRRRERDRRRGGGQRAHPRPTTTATPSPTGPPGSASRSSPTDSHAHGHPAAGAHHPRHRETRVEHDHVRGAARVQRADVRQAQGPGRGG